MPAPCDPPAVTESWPVTVEVKVPWRDVDGAGHVNNAVYLSYLEMARAESWVRHFGWKRVEDFHVILARAEIDFVSAAGFGDALVVSCWPTRIGSSSFDYAYEVREKEGGRLVARAATVQVAFDYVTGKKKPIPPEWRKALDSGLPRA